MCMSALLFIDLERVREVLEKFVTEAHEDKTLLFHIYSVIK